MIFDIPLLFIFEKKGKLNEGETLTLSNLDFYWRRFVWQLFSVRRTGQPGP